MMGRREVGSMEAAARKLTVKLYLPQVFYLLDLRSQLGVSQVSLKIRRRKKGRKCRTAYYRSFWQGGGLDGLDKYIRQNINNYIEQKQLMNDYHSRSPQKDAYNTHQPTAKRTADPPLLELRHQFASSALIADRHLAITRKNLQQYEEEFDYNIINQLVREICEYDPNGEKSTKVMRYGEADEEQRARNADSRNYRSKKKELSKYKAYAVKMKISSNHDFNKPKQKDLRVGGTSQFKNKSQLRFKHDSRANFTKMEEIFRANVRDIAIANIFESGAVNIFKKKPNKVNKNANIRKRSIKTSDKRREDDEVKQSLNKFLKTSTSPKITKKYIISLDQSTMEQKPNERAINNQSRQVETEVKRGTGMLTKLTMKSPQKETRQVVSQNKSTNKAEYDSNSKFLQKMEQAIQFRKKQLKKSSPSKEAIKEHHAQSTEMQRSNQPDLQLAQASKTVIRTIYTSKDVIRNKSNIIKQSASREFDTNKKQHPNNKVFVFNSEDQYIRKALTQSGWIHNHDHRSQFYHLKWVFKPDAIDYHNLKAGQFVNHVRNSHQLTAKNYLNKNLKAYVSSWTSLGSCYPKCYDFSISSQKQQFYSQFKKEVMMILLRNAYQYFLSMKTLKVETLTCFYFQQLNQDGSYRLNQKGESELRKKTFRKIDMEDYRQYDNSFLVHMNLLIIALRYWRAIRKDEELEEDEESHFLSYRDREFQDNFHHLERYSKMNLLYSADSSQPYFQREYFATPSDIAIERVVKEYVYFQNQLGSHWQTFGKGNIWIIKPCSASRGNGIYLANDCSQILTDNRGIQSKIVQKYIQRPLIFNSGIAKGRKFDLRQWVLLRSIQPLQIYMFSHCYVRICSEEFDITNINNLKAHLTNYSFNKRHYKQPAQSVIDQDSFQQMLITERNVDFVGEIRPKIKEIIIKSIKATQILISDCGQRCFSLLGYDVLLDENCQPWLLEVNMSPACEERTEWLKSYLEVMGKELLKIVLPNSYVQSINKEGIPREKSLSPSMSPMKKNWSPVDWSGDAFQLKKVKTQMSQANGDLGQQRQSYVNTIFELDQGRQRMEMLENKINDEQPLEGESQEEQNEDENSESEESNGWQKLDVEEEIDAVKEQPKRMRKSEMEIDRQKEKFANMELYLNEQVDQNIPSPNKMNPSKTLGQSAFNSKSASPQKIETQAQETPLLVQLKINLRWQRICFEEYSGIKKDSDFQMEVMGSKIATDKIVEIERYIDYTQQQNDVMVDNCITVQRSIRNFLEIVKVKRRQSEKNNLKINLTRFAKLEEKERESKSALYTREEKSFNGIERSNQREGFFNLKIQVSRPITARNNSNLSSSKLKTNSHQASFRQKIRSIALQAASRQSGREQQILEMHLDQPANSQSPLSHTSIHQNFIAQ